jgi:carbon-monoxide dehydrogenase medium subunit
MLSALPSFEYYRPSTLEEAVALQARHDGELCFLAGGTDLLVKMKEGKLRYGVLVDIKRIPEMGSIRPENGVIRLGAAVTSRAIARSPLVRERLPLLSRALGLLGSMQIGNRATIGGNLCNASPAADSAPPLLVLGASVKLIGARGERKVPLENFFLDPGKTVMDREMLTEIQVPAASAQGRGFFYKLGLRAAPEDIALVSVALFGVPDAGGKNWQDLRIALGALAPTAIRALHAEEALRGQPIGRKSAADASRLAAEKDSNPITDIRASAKYRRAMVELLVRRALEQVTREIPGASKL